MKRVVAIVLVVGLVLGAVASAVLVLRGGGDDPQSTSTRTAAPSPRSSEPVPAADPALARFEDQEIDWQPCRAQADLDCARLTVPLDYRDPGGDTLTLALNRAPARKPAQRVGSLVFNPGGPGVPGTTYVAAAGQVFGAALLDHFDVIGFDPRGTGDSSPVDCLSDSALDTYLAADPDPESPAEAQAFVAGVRRFNQGCVQRSGDVAAHVSTVETVRDLDVLRAALDEAQLDFLGVSYGTKLGGTYAQLFPDRVGRMVLDGAIDLQLTRRQSSLQNAVGFETALDAYLQNCVAQPDCFLGDTVAAAETRLVDFLQGVDRTPLSTSSGRELTGGLATYGVLYALYSRSFWTTLSVGLQQAFDGDGSTLLTFADALNSRGPDGYLSNLQEAIVDINCLDDPSVASVRQVEADLPAFEKASPVFGAAIAWSQVVCAGFTPRAAETPPDDDAAGAEPILVVGTTRDPATPYRWAQALAAQLSSAVLVTRDGDGHTGYHSGNECVDTTIEDYLVDGTVPSGPVSC